MSNNKTTNQSLDKIQDAIVNGQQPLYELFKNDSARRILANVPLVNTRWRGGVSKRSLSIRCENTGKGGDLARIFGLNATAFEEKYQEAIAGDGQESRRIRTLHSSSLISLLCFQGISTSRPLLISIEGREIEFFESHFEKKNPIGCDETGKEHESNMDVLLMGRDKDTGRNVVLFLESKFSEYLTWGKYSDISNYVYGKTYAQLSDGGVLEKMGLKLEVNPDNPNYSDLASVKGKTLHYAGGIKQMVSHFLGVKNAADSDGYKGYDIYLGEILYKFPESMDPAYGKFEDYNGLYKILAEGLNDLSEGKFKILGQCLTYQEVFKSFDLDEAVRGFYSL